MTMRSKRPAQRSHQYPLATLAAYGPDNTCATKLVASVLERPGQREPAVLRTWTTENIDVRTDRTIAADVAQFFGEYGVKHTAVSDRIIGCPHQEGIDYPMGRSCPRCPFWMGIDRFTHEPVEVPTPTLSPSDILETLSRDVTAQPTEALDSADAWREALIDPFLAALDHCIGNPTNAAIPEANLFSYALYLFAKWREPRAYSSVIRWLSLPDEQPFEIGGDIVTQDGARILASVCDGDLAPIKALILNRDANEYGRGAGVGALALLAAWAEVPRDTIVEHFQWLATEGLEREPGQAWDSLVAACADIEALSVFPELRRAYSDGLADPMSVSPQELDAIESAPAGRELEVMRSRWPPIDDVAHATSWWSAFKNNHGPYDGNEEWAGDGPDEPQQPYRAPIKVGRNEPCPCGSGKKYKKCCGK
ncbi:MAG: DUF1186 domain-containing protein [Vicinamibacterales bacterium]